MASGSTEDELAQTGGMTQKQVRKYRALLDEQHSLEEQVRRHDWDEAIAKRWTELLETAKIWANLEECEQRRITEQQNLFSHLQHETFALESARRAQWERAHPSCWTPSRQRQSPQQWSW